MVRKVSLRYWNKVGYNILCVKLLLNPKYVNFLGFQPIVLVRKHVSFGLETMATYGYHNLDFFFILLIPCLTLEIYSSHF
jgi:hypothetical protein